MATEVRRGGNNLRASTVLQGVVIREAVAWKLLLIREVIREAKRQ